MTKLSRHVCQLNNPESTVRLVATVLVVMLFLICFSLYFEHHGFNMGLLAAQSIISSSQDPLQVSLQGPSTYEYFANRYLISTALVVLVLICNTADIFLIRSSARFRVLSNLSGIVASSLVFFQFRQIFFQKNLRSEELFLSEPFDILLRNSAFYDWVCLISLSLIGIMQVYLLISSSRIYLKR